MSILAIYSPISQQGQKGFESTSVSRKAMRVRSSAVRQSPIQVVT